MAVFGDGLLTISAERISIDTALSAREATQAKLLQYLTETGVIIAQDDNGFTFTPWLWTGSHEEIAPGRKNDSVFADGEGFDGKPLLELLDAATKTDGAVKELSEAIQMLSRAVEYAASEDTPLPNNGPLGTIIGTDGRILLLPEAIFSRAIESRSDRDGSYFAGCWKNTALNKLTAWRFTLAVYAYCYLAGALPFPEQDSQHRVADYFDKNFIPLEWRCTLKDAGDCRKLFSCIQTNLMAEAPVPMTEKQKRKLEKNKKNKKNISVYTEPKTEPLPELPAFTARTCHEYSQTDAFEKQQKKLKKVRFFRQYSSIIKGCSIAAVLLILFIITTIRDKMALPTTKGLEPVEVVEMFYDGFDRLDTSVFDATHEKGVAPELTNFLTSIFVNSKMRQAYEGLSMYTISQAMNLRTLNNVLICGITNLEIENATSVLFDTSDSTSETAPQVYIAHYYIVHNAYQEFTITEETDRLTLLWKKDHWTIIDCSTVEVIETTVPASFADEFISLLPTEATDDQASIIIDALGEKYPWLPTKEEAARGLEQLKQNENSLF